MEAGTFPYLSLENIESQSGEITPNPNHNFRALGTSNCFRFGSEHVLYGKLRPYLNKVALPDFSGRCTTEIIPLLPGSEIDREFLALTLRRAETVDWAVAETTGSRMPRTNMKHLMRLAIPLPPFAEQKRIVAALNEKMAAVEQARAAALERVEAVRALPAAFLREVFCFGDGELPSGWRWAHLSEICNCIRGVNFKKSVVSHTSTIGYLPILRAGNIGEKLDTENDLVWVSQDYVSEEQLLRIGDIVVCMSSGSPSVVGKTASLQKEWAGSVGAFCGIIRVKRQEHSQYLSLWLRSSNYLKWRDKQARGANIQNLRFSEFGGMAIPLPPLAKQKQIVADLNQKITATETARVAAEAELDAISALPAAFLRQAFSGAL